MEEGESSRRPAIRLRIDVFESGMWLGCHIAFDINRVDFAAQWTVSCRDFEQLTMS